MAKKGINKSTIKRIALAQAVQHLLLDLYVNRFEREADPVAVATAWRASLDRQGAAASYPDLSPEMSDLQAAEFHQALLGLADGVLARIARRPRPKRSGGA